MEKLTDLSPSAPAAAVEANINARMRLIYVHMPGIEVVDEPCLLGMSSRIPDTLLNSVYWAGFRPELDQIWARIDEGLDRFRTRGSLPMSWSVSPATRPRDLGSALEAHGFTSVFRGVPGMTVDLEEIGAARHGPDGLAVELISDVERLAQWLHLLKVSFDLQDVTASAHRDLFAGQGFGPDLPWWVPSSARRRVAENVGQGMTSETTKTEGVRGPHAEANLIWSELKAGLELGI